MSAYAIGHLRDVAFGPEIVEYLERIDATLAPFGGEFLVHGARPAVHEGSWDGDLVIIGFPDLATARAWYGSDAYQALVPLRAENSHSTVLLVDGCEAGHLGRDLISQLAG
jgi:uncharacterized protein (DUF1330 family)